MDCRIIPCTEATRRQPRVILVTSGIVVGVLRYPQAVVRRYRAPILFGADRAGHIHDASNASQLIDAIQEAFSAIGADASIHLIVKHGNAMPKIALACLIEIIGLSNRIFFIHEVVEAEELSHVDRRLNERIARAVDDARSLCGFADHEIVVDCV